MIDIKHLKDYFMIPKMSPLSLGLSAPVPRGRKGKKVKTQSSSFDIHKAEWLRKHNPEHILQDDGYKKHLKHHCNKYVFPYTTSKYSKLKDTLYQVLICNQAFINAADDN